MPRPLTVHHQDPQNPLVWCDCFRAQISLELKLQDLRCVLCREDAGEDTRGELTPAAVGVLEDRLRRLDGIKLDAEGKVEHLEEQLAAAERDLETVEEEIEQIHRQLGKVAYV